MYRHRHHLPIYYLLGKLVQIFMMLLYGFFILGLLLVIGVGAETARGFIVTGLPWFLRIGLTLGCGIAALSLLEGLSQGSR